MDIFWSDSIENDGIEGLCLNVWGLGFVIFGLDCVKVFCEMNGI